MKNNMSWFPSIDLSIQKASDMKEITDSSILSNKDLMKILTCREFDSVFAMRTQNFKAVLQEAQIRMMIPKSDFDFFDNF